MKKLIAILVGTLTLNAIAYADVAYTQNVVTSSPTGNQSLKTVTRIKGTKVRIDVGEKSTILLDRESGRKMVLIHPQKLCLVTSPQAEAEQMAMIRNINGQTMPAERTPTLEPTGRTETINGFETEEYTWKAASGSGSMWIAKDVADAKVICDSIEALARPTRMMSNFPSLAGIKGIPIKVESRFAMRLPPGAPSQVAKNMPSEITSTSAIIEIKRDEIDKSIFQMPSGYRVIQQ